MISESVNKSPKKKDITTNTQDMIRNYYHLVAREMEKYYVVEDWMLENQQLMENYHAQLYAISFVVYSFLEQ